VAALTELDALKIPARLRPETEEVVRITDSVCLALLDEEYADLARRAVAKLSRQRPSPLLSGRIRSASGRATAVESICATSGVESEPRRRAYERQYIPARRTQSR
jgi:Domain of unknown function (DUF6398)